MSSVCQSGEKDGQVWHNHGRGIFSKTESKRDRQRLCSALSWRSPVVARELRTQSPLHLKDPCLSHLHPSWCHHCPFPTHMPPSPYPSYERSQKSGMMGSLDCHIESRNCVQRGACPLNPRAQHCILWGRKNLRDSSSPQLSERQPCYFHPRGFLTWAMC